jgi:phytol kinase
MTDPLALLISFIYVFIVLGLAEGLRKAFHFEAEFTRKVVHVGVGMWSWGTAWLFQNKWFAVIPPAVFVVLNYLSYRRGLFQAMELKDRSNLGTVFFPISFVAMILLFFSMDDPAKKGLFAVALMPMTWGDAFAAILGRTIGKHKYTFLRNTRSWEGTLAMFGLSFISVWAALLVFWQPAQVNMPVLVTGAIALITATFAATVEAFSPWGLDNLLVPVASAAGLFLGMMIFAA